MKKFATSGLLLLTVALAGSAQASTKTSKPALRVVAGAKALTSMEKVDVTGKHCGCPTKPGYGFGTTGHYGPPGQGFTTRDNWRRHADGDGLTPTGRPLPPRAFN